MHKAVKQQVPLANPPPLALPSQRQRPQDFSVRHLRSKIQLSLQIQFLVVLPIKRMLAALLVDLGKTLRIRARRQWEPGQVCLGVEGSGSNRSNHSSPLLALEALARLNNNRSSNNSPQEVSSAVERSEVINRRSMLSVVVRVGSFLVYTALLINIY